MQTSTKVYMGEGGWANRATFCRVSVCPFRQLTPTKMSLGQSEWLQTPLPSRCPKGRVCRAPTPFHTDDRLNVVLIPIGVKGMESV